MRILFLLLTLAIFYSVALGDEIPIGHLVIEKPKKLDVKREGRATPVILEGNKGEVWQEKESYKLEHKEFNVYNSRNKDRKILARVSYAGAMMQIVTMSSPGKCSAQSVKEAKTYQQGKYKILVFDKKGDWLKTYFRSIPPYNGRSAWLKLSEINASYVSYKKAP